MTDPGGSQRRGRSITMTSEELDAFLMAAHTCRLASRSADGTLHNTPLWFVWHDRRLWISSVIKSRRWNDLRISPGVSVVVDAGERYDELLGVEVIGEVAVVGEVPRMGEPNPDLTEVESRFGVKYSPTGAMYHDGRHAWLSVTPSRIVSWDFRKRRA
jgi:hypothetical protein